jgi:hypothetical protein
MGMILKALSVIMRVADSRKGCSMEPRRTPSKVRKNFS